MLAAVKLCIFPNFERFTKKQVHNALEFLKIP